MAKKLTTLKKLRNLIDLTVPEMAKLLDYSVSGIEKIERGGAVTEMFAATVSERTGIDFLWMVRGDVNAPMVATDGTPYTIEHFERKRMGMVSAAGAETSCEALLAAFPQLVGLLARILVVGYEQGKPDIACFRVLNSLIQAGEEFGGREDIEKTIERRGFGQLKSVQAQIAVEVFRDELIKAFQRRVDAAKVSERAATETASTLAWAKARAARGKPQVKAGA